MKTILLVDRDRRTFNEVHSVLAAHHKVVAVHAPSAALRFFKKCGAEVVLVKTAAGDRDAVALLQGFKEHDVKVPVVVLVGAGASGEVAKVRRLGASAILRWPTPRERLSEVIAAPGKTAASGVGAVPMISSDERQTDVTQLKRRLNRDMKCPAGSNKVYIRSVLVGNGVATSLRVSLKCPLRAEVGLVADVYYEDIRDRCCGSPDACPAVRIFRRRPREGNNSVLTAHAAGPVQHDQDQAELGRALDISRVAERLRTGSARAKCQGRACAPNSPI